MPHSADSPLHSHDIGHRMVIRVRAGVRDGRPVFRDHLGTLAALSPETVTVLTRAGAVTLPRADVHRAKRVPPAPPPR